MRNVAMVVPEFTMSCHSVENPNTGPVRSQTTISSAATRNAVGAPIHSAMRLAKRENV